MASCIHFLAVLSFHIFYMFISVFFILDFCRICSCTVHHYNHSSHISGRISERKEGVVNSSIVKLSSVQAFKNIDKENEIADQNHYRAIFRQAAKKVVVVVRIYNLVKQCSTEINEFMFYENDESRLYRKFLNNWSTYWHKKQEKIEEKLRKHKEMYFAKPNKHAAGNVGDANYLMTAEGTED